MTKFSLQFVYCIKIDRLNKASICQHRLVCLHLTLLLPPSAWLTCFPCAHPFLLHPFYVLQCAFVRPFVRLHRVLYNAWELEHAIRSGTRQSAHDAGVGYRRGLWEVKTTRMQLTLGWSVSAAAPRMKQVDKVDWGEKEQGERRGKRLIERGTVLHLWCRSADCRLSLALLSGCVCSVCVCSVCVCSVCVCSVCLCSVCHEVIKNNNKWFENCSGNLGIEYRESGIIGYGWCWSWSCGYLDRPISLPSDDNSSNLHRVFVITASYSFHAKTASICTRWLMRPFNDYSLNNNGATDTKKK